MRLTILTLILAALIYDVCAAATLYMGSEETYTNLQAAMAAMSSGDTLIIRDGTYTGATNAIDSTHLPPNGNYGIDETDRTPDDVWTTIQAENTGSVLFDGEGTVRQCWVYGSNYIHLEGIIWGNQYGSVSVDNGASNVKFINCGSYDCCGTGRTDNFDAYGASYVLWEGCYAWGNGRYGIHAHDSNYCIMRRCVVRKDRCGTAEGSTCAWGTQAGFAAYGATHCEIQNCIALDFTTDYYFDNDDSGTDNTFAGVWAFQEAYGTTDINCRGNISLNLTGVIQNQGSACIGMIAASSNSVYQNNVSWSAWRGVVMSGTNADCRNNTVGNNTDTSLYASSYAQTSGTFINSVAYNGIYGRENTAETSDYLCLYGHTTDYTHGAEEGAHDILNIDPIDGTPGNGTTALKYLVRIEDNSDLDGAASDSGDIGATILKKIGTSGTLWGETGYNTTTTDDLWPFPNEDLIKTKMAAYTYDDGSGGDPEITGARGFAATGKQLNGTDDITLTSYIWEYLGNEIPSDIYGETPTCSGVSINGGSMQ